MLAPSNEQLINFVYSSLLLFIAYCRLCHVYIVLQWAWAIMSLAKQVYINWLLMYFEMSRLLGTISVYDYSHTFIDFAFKIPPVFTPLKSYKSDLDVTRLQGKHT